MFKILKPFWNRASLGCPGAPLKKGLRISKIPANGIHRTDHHWIHWLSKYWSYLYACGVSVCGDGSKIKEFLFPAKSPRCSLGGGAQSMHAREGGQCRAWYYHFVENPYRMVVPENLGMEQIHLDSKLRSV